MIGRNGVFSRKRPMMQSLTGPEGAASVDLSGVPRAVRWIPKPDVPVSPVLSVPSLFTTGDRRIASVLDVGKPVFLTAGRMAIAQALKIMGAQPGDKVLLPAYHCIAMVEPLSSIGAEPVFYKLREDLAVDLDDIAAKIDDRTRILIATNYFGFPNNLCEIREFCDDQGLSFLEDCAHSLFGTYQGQPLGSFGHFAIASAHKFLPVRDGGCLVSQAHPEELNDIRLNTQSTVAQLRQVFDSFEEAVYYGRLPLLLPLIALAKAAKLMLHSIRDSGGPAQNAGATNPSLLRAGIPGEFDGAWVDVEGSWMSKFICTSAARQRVAERRRRYFETFLSALSGYGQFRPLFTELSDDVVPYMFPLYVNNLKHKFQRLEDLAVPMQRFGQFLWRGVSDDTCPNSLDFSCNVVQFPCHQELTDAEIESIILRVLQVLEAA
jgi:dTDP-4-amino-4,6-dideoxygalactose transaminase